ncbi:MAG TPA: aminotransferase [Flavobacteriales bacterium]|nr:aminotransferase [Flavobacteriales bacterium]
MRVPFNDVQLINQSVQSEIEEAFRQVFNSGSFVLGKNVKAFEENYAAYNQTKEAVGVSSGLDALILSLKALGIGTGDEVIVPSNTYIATAIAVSHVGATPVFVEPKKDTYNLDPSLIEAAITNSTRAIIPVHLYGQACQMHAINGIANKHDLFLVEDNAQAHGSSFDGRRTGSWGDANATSFYPGKNLGALGDGGAITTDNEELAERIKTLRNYGSSKKYYNDLIGYNNRLDEMQAAFLSVKLKYLNCWTEMRQKAANQYLIELQDVGDLILPVTHPLSTHVYHLFVVRTDKRDQLQIFLTDNGVGTLIHYPVPPHLQRAYESLGHTKGDFPIAERMAETCLSLPMYPGITESQIHQVVAGVKAFFSE